MREFGLIGRSLSHSFSAKWFAEKFRNEGITDCTYSLFELSEIEELPRFLSHHPHLEGFNVTIPYKQTIIRYLDGLSSEAEAIGAVNCVKREAGQWIGYNTDAQGFAKALTEWMPTPPDQALILGTGGASQAVQYVLMQLDIPYELVSRDPMRGHYTYDNLPCEVIERSQLIIQATPVGTYPQVEHAPRIPYAFLTPEHYLFDLVYNPPKSTFLAYGEERGAHLQNGYSMLIGQANAAWEIWNRP